jgi:multicomponent Na+:H+ antiporter subunit G
MEAIINTVVGLLILLGAVLSFLSAIGLLRFPDVYTRSHAASKSSTLGVISILSGAFLFFWLIEGHVSARLILGIVFVFLTAPVAGHLICRAAYRSKVPLWEKSRTDELRPALKPEDYRHNAEQ